LLLLECIQPLKLYFTLPPVGVRIHDAILIFNVPWLERHLEPDCNFALLNVP
jgi:hypothetical protein